jgi:hypothetical protein
MCEVTVAACDDFRLIKDRRQTILVLFAKIFYQNQYYYYDSLTNFFIETRPGRSETGK